MKARVSLIVVIAAAVTVLTALPGVASDTWQELMPGVQHLHRVTPTPWDIHVLTVDLTNPHVRVRTVIKNDNDWSDGGETVLSMCRRYNAAAGINTDYFGWDYAAGTAHCPQGHTVTDGLTMVPTGWLGPIVPDRTTLQVNNTQAAPTNAFALVGIVTSPLPWWWNVTAGGPRIIRNGVVGWESEPDIPDQVSRQPRTALAVSQDYKKLVIATCDGRQADSVGMTANEIGNLLVEFGGYNGVDFDSGGSTTMVINGVTANHPSDGTDRLVAAGLIIMDSFAQPPDPAVQIETGFEYPDYYPATLDSFDGWTSTGDAQIVSGGNTGSYAARIVDGTATRLLNPIPQTGCQWVEWWGKVNAKPGSGLVTLAGYVSAGDAAAVGFRETGNIEYFEGNGNGGGTYRSLGPYDANTWYRFGLRLDYRLKSYQVFLNGKLVASGVRFKDALASVGLVWMRLEETSAATSEFYVDDVYAGNVDPAFPRVFPDSFRLPVQATRLMQLKSASGSPSFQLIDQKNSAGEPAVVASIAPTGELTALAPGTCRVRGTDPSGRVDESAVITIVAGAPLGDVRKSPDGTQVDISGSVVTADFGTSFFIEEPDRSSAVKVVPGVGGLVQVGHRVAVSGAIETSQNERYIAASSVFDLGAAQTPLRPVVVGNWSAARPQDSILSSPGTPTAGMLVRTSGRIVRIDPDRIWVDDGSQRVGETPGLAVICKGIDTQDLNRFAIVTGTVSTIGFNGGYVGAVWAVPDGVRVLP